MTSDTSAIVSLVTVFLSLNLNFQFSKIRLHDRQNVKSNGNNCRIQLLFVSLQKD